MCLLQGSHLHKLLCFDKVLKDYTEGSTGNRRQVDMYTLWNVFLISTSLKIQIFTKCIKMVDIPKCDDINREVFHHKLDYQPGHVICRGKTNRSYNWFPIAPSPVASHTRAKIRVVKFFFCLFFLHGLASWAKCGLLPLWCA